MQFGAIERDDAIDAGAWVFEKRRGPFRAAALPPLCPVHAPLLAAPLAETETNLRRSPLDALLRALDESVDQATFALPPGADARPYLWAGWTALPRYTHQIPLQEGDLASRYSAIVRRTIRNEAASFEIAEGARYAEVAIAQTEAAYRRHDGSMGIGPSAIRRLVAATGEAGLTRTVTALRGGRPEAAIIAAIDERVSYYWIAGSEPGPAMAVLLDAVLRQFQTEGVERLDLAGANVPGIAEFKRKFGGDLVVGHQVRRVSNHVLRLVDGLRRR